MTFIFTYCYVHLRQEEINSKKKNIAHSAKLINGAVRIKIQVYMNTMSD